MLNELDLLFKKFVVAELDNDGELLEDGEMNDERVVVKGGCCMLHSDLIFKMCRSCGTY